MVCDQEYFFNEPGIHLTSSQPAATTETMTTPTISDDAPSHCSFRKHQARNFVIILVLLLGTCWFLQIFSYKNYDSVLGIIEQSEEEAFQTMGPDSFVDVDASVSIVCKREVLHSAPTQTINIHFQSQPKFHLGFLVEQMYLLGNS